MSNDTALSSAIVLVDPVSSGKHLKSYVRPLGYKLIAVFTISDDLLKAAGKALAPEEKFRHCDEVFESNNVDEIQAWLLNLGYRIRAIIPASEPAVEIAEALSMRFGTIGNNPSTSSLRRNKWAARNALRNAGIQGPNFLKCHSEADIIEFAKNHSFPLVLKTPEGAGGHQVFFCDTVSRALEAHRNILSASNIFGKSAAFSLIEEFIEGSHYVVELFAIGGQRKVTSIWQFEFDISTAGRIEFNRARLITENEELESLSEVVSYGLSVARTLGVDWGPCLVELRKHKTRGPMMIELGARLSGIELPVILREVSNFDPFHETLRLFSGTKTDSTSVQYLKSAVLAFIRSNKGGKVRSIEGMSKIRALPSYFNDYLFIKPGCFVYPAEDLATIPLYLYLNHEDHQVLSRDEAIARELFQIRFELERDDLLEPLGQNP